MQSDSSSKRTVLITGGNKGIGYSIVDGLLAGDTPYDIIFTSRNPEAGKHALEKLQHAHKDSKSTVTMFQLNLTDSISIQHIVDFIKNDRKKIDVLVNNSGILTRPETPLSKVETINVNLLSTIDLTEKVLPYLSPDGKIIMMSSTLGLLEHQGEAIQKQLTDPDISKEKFLQLSGRLYEECEQGTHTDSGFSESAYNASKALLNAYTRWILPKMLKGDQQCYSVCPGWCKTDLGGSKAPKTAEEGADTPIYLINLPFKMNKDLNGKFIKEKKPIDF